MEHLLVQHDSASFSKPVGNEDQTVYHCLLCDKPYKGKKETFMQFRGSLVIMYFPPDTIEPCTGCTIKRHKMHNVIGAKCPCRSTKGPESVLREWHAGAD